MSKKSLKYNIIYSFLVFASISLKPLQLISAAFATIWYGVAISTTSFLLEELIVYCNTYTKESCINLLKNRTCNSSIS